MTVPLYGGTSDSVGELRLEPNSLANQPFENENGDIVAANIRFVLFDIEKIKVEI